MRDLRRWLPAVDLGVLLFSLSSVPGLRVVLEGMFRRLDIEKRGMYACVVLGVIITLASNIYRFDVCLYTNVVRRK